MRLCSIRLILKGEKHMKRIVSYLLAVLLALMPCQQAIAAESATGRSIAPGQVDVSVISALTLKKKMDFQVSLTNQDTKEKKTLRPALTLPEDNGEQPAKAEGSFEDLVPGTYELRVEADGFAPYTQSIPVADKAYGVKLLTGFVASAGYAYTEGGVHPGVLLIGDADGDGDIDDADRKRITDTIDTGGYDAGADLNGDGKVDLADLEYFTKGYQESRHTVSTVETSIPAAKVSVRETNGTTVKGGNLSSLLKGGESVKLAPSNGKDISAANPVTVEFDLQAEQMEGIVIDAGLDHPIETAEIEIVSVDNSSKTVSVTGDARSASLRAFPSEEPKFTNVNGVICIHLNGQVPVKKVTLRITGLQKNNNLAEISKVTFIGDMASRIPEPAADIPENLKAEPANASFTLTWDEAMNVTGYEVSVAEKEGKDGKEPVSDVIQVTGNTLAVSSLAGNTKLENFRKYVVKVRATNGLWRSGYCTPIEVEPKPTKIPDPPDNLKAVGRYQSVQVSWKKMKDSAKYNLYYKQADAAEYIKIEGIVENSYDVANLQDHVKYLFYVTGVNELGEGKPSLTASAVTKDLELAKVPQYQLINRTADGAQAHITNATIGSGTMQASPKDTDAKTAWGSVDKSPTSYYELASWDSGGYNALGGNGLIYEFDQAYKMKMIALQEQIDQDVSYGYAQIRYWDADGKESMLNKGEIAIQKKTDVEGRVYYMLRLIRPITAKKIQIGLARSVASGTITVSELYFYHFDPLEDDIMALYTDDLHTVLRSDVTQATIDELRKRVNTKDPDCGEYHPDRDMLERELKTAEDILNSEPHAPAHIHSGITTNDVNRGFGGLNAWQPLGIVAAAGEELTIYVGHNQKYTGDKTNLQLVATQYHSESSPMFQVIGTLKIGRNDITVPKIWTTDDESGGALYVQYTGKGVNDDYAVRVSGGVEVPVLDLYQVTDESERMARITRYLTDLGNYTDQMEANHAKLHEGSANVHVKYPYNVQNCILGATDLLLDTVMLSLPAPQVLAGCGRNADTLNESMHAMEDMMHLFYQHKGLNKNAEKAIDQIPKGHQNIRYQRMFAGAFMYASGNHVGIEYGSTAGMVSGKRVQKTEDGKGTAGQYFGWGIGHEIGHCINQGAYAVAEITNNYFSVLAQAKDNNHSVRFQYDEVYQKVTSNTKGRANNVFTQLGMYWQLHLAYDKGYNYKTYENYEDQLNNLFFARVDAYARTPANAPAPKGIALTLPGDTDQNLMRLACAAAQKNILEFFERWGMTPDEGTIAYAEQFEKEDRAIYYTNDDARVYQIENGAGNTANTGTVRVVSQPGRTPEGPTVTIKLTSDDLSSDEILGYEIIRHTTSNGDPETELAGFAVPETGSVDATFTDTVTLKNRVITYEVRAVNKYLYAGKSTVLEPFKIQDGKSYLNRSGWTISTNDLTATNLDSSGFDTEAGTEADVSCGAQEASLQRALLKALDGQPDTAYTGKAGQNAEIVLEFHQSLTVTGFEYMVQSGTPIGSYKLSVRDRNGGWTEAADGSFGSVGTHEIYFAEKTQSGNIAGYQTTAVKLTIPGQSGTEISVSELHVLGVAGDHVEFGTMTVNGEEKPAIGVLKETYDNSGKAATLIPDGTVDDVHDQKAADVTSDGAVGYSSRAGTAVRIANQTAGYADTADPAANIPQGSLVFTGTYRGNSAYNVVILYDSDGNIIGGQDADGALLAQQLIFTTDSEEGTGPIQNTYEGIWIYWINPELADDTVKKLQGKQIRAELYRVDNALTNEGQRLVSDTFFVDMPVAGSVNELPEIQIHK